MDEKYKYINLYNLRLTVDSKDAQEFLQTVRLLFNLSFFIQKKQKMSSAILKSPHVFSKSKQKFKFLNITMNVLVPNSYILRLLYKLLPHKSEVYITKTTYFIKEKC